MCPVKRTKGLRADVFAPTSPFFVDPVSESNVKTRVLLASFAKFEGNGVQGPGVLGRRAAESATYFERDKEISSV